MSGFKTPRYTQVPNDLLGDRHLVGYMADMKLSELKVVLAICRLTFGYHKARVRASLTALQEMTGLSRPAVLSGADAAVQRGLLARDATTGVTAWSVVFADELVNNFNQQDAEVVKNFNQSGKKTLPPSIKETCKETHGAAREMFQALADLCQMDLALIAQKERGMLNQTGGILRKEGHTPTELEAFGEWWYANDWRGRMGQAPTPAQVRQTWGQYEAAGRPPVPRRRTKRVEVILPDGTTAEKEMIM